MILNCVYSLQFTPPLCNSLYRIGREHSDGIPAGLDTKDRRRNSALKLTCAKANFNAACGAVRHPTTTRRPVASATVQAAEAGAAGQQGAGGPAVAGGTDRVAALFSRGKLISIPRAGGLRTELLRSLAERFEHGRTYSEADIKREFEPLYDHAVLRRYLVDERLLERDNHGSYWRPAQPPG